MSPKRQRDTSLALRENRSFDRLSPRSYPANWNMNKSSRKLSNPVGAVEPKSSTNVPRSSRRWMSYFAALVVVATASFYLVLNFVLPKVPGEFAGKWLVEGGPMGSAELQIQRSGSFVARVPGKEEFVEGRVEVHEKSLRFITVNPFTNKEDAKQQRIKQLSAQEMILEDPQGKVMRLVRRE
jgi:hypothetical protein